jgi:hypothetical protein
MQAQQQQAKKLQGRHPKHQRLCGSSMTSRNISLDPTTTFPTIKIGALAISQTPWDHGKYPGA